MPLVSLVVPSRLQGRFLGTCLESLLAQTYPRIEVLLYDNCSDDETVDVLRRYRDRLRKVVVESDAGQAAALRRGFSEARGDILGWLNADDMLMPHAVEAAVRAFEAQPAADVVYGDCAVLDAKGGFCGYFHYIDDFDATALRNYNDFIAQPSTFFRRTAYEAVGGLDGALTYAFDWDLWCRLARGGSRFARLHDVLSGARVHAEAKTSRGGWKRLLEVSRVNCRHKTRRLPMVPVLYLAHLIAGSSGLRKAPPLYRACRWIWRHTAGGPEVTKAVVLGVAHGPCIVESRAQVTFPVYRPLKGMRVSLGSPAVDAVVTVDGRAAERSADGYWAAYSSDPEWRDCVTVDIELLSAPPRPVSVTPLPEP